MENKLKTKTDSLLKMPQNRLVTRRAKNYSLGLGLLAIIIAGILLFSPLGKALQSDQLPLLGILTFVSLLLTMITNSILYHAFEEGWIISNAQKAWYITNILLLIIFGFLIYLFLAKDGFHIFDLVSIRNIDNDIMSWAIGYKVLFFFAILIQLAMTVLISGFKMERSRNSHEIPTFLKIDL